MKKLAVLFVVGSLAAAASAQETVGTLQGVSGVVSISGKNIVSRAKDGVSVTEGASVLISSTGKATLVLKNGCTVSLGANQHLTVNSNLPCEQMTASVKHLFPAYQVAQAPVRAGIPGSGMPGALDAGVIATPGGVAAAATPSGVVAATTVGSVGTLAGISLGVIGIAAAVNNNNNSNSVSGF